jgi:hypothetical protein
MASLPPPPGQILIDPRAEQMQSPVQMPQLPPPPQQGPPTMLAPPPPGVPIEKKPSFWDKIKPYTPLLGGAALAAVGGENSKLGKFGLGFATAQSNNLLETHLENQRAQLDQDQNLIKNVHKTMQDIGRLDDPNDPRQQKAQQVKAEYDQAMADGKLTAKEAAKLQSDALGIGDIEQMLKEKEYKAQTSEYENRKKIDQRLEDDQRRRTAINTDINGQQVPLSPEHYASYMAQQAAQERLGKSDHDRMGLEWAKFNHQTSSEGLDKKLAAIQSGTLTLDQLPAKERGEMAALMTERGVQSPAKLSQQDKSTLENLNTVAPMVAELKQTLGNVQPSLLGDIASAANSRFQGTLYKNGITPTTEQSKKLMALASQLKIIAAQPYVKNSRSYQWIQQVQQHIPDPYKDSEALMSKKLQNLSKTLGYINNSIQATPAASNPNRLPPPPGGGQADQFAQPQTRVINGHNYVKVPGGWKLQQAGQ